MTSADGQDGRRERGQRVDPKLWGLMQLSPTEVGKEGEHGDWTSYTGLHLISDFHQPPQTPRRLRLSFHSAHFTDKENNTQDAQRGRVRCPRAHSQ